MYILRQLPLRKIVPLMVTRQWTCPQMRHQKISTTRTHWLVCLHEEEKFPKVGAAVVHKTVACHHPPLIIVTCSSLCKKNTFERRTMPYQEELNFDSLSFFYFFCSECSATHPRLKKTSNISTQAW